VDRPPLMAARGFSNAFDNRAIWRIAAPMVLSSATTPLLGLVDTAVVGHLPDPQYLAAVGTGSTIFSVLFMGLNFLRMGTTGVTAQAFGTADGSAVRDSLGQALLIALVLATVILSLQGPIISIALALLAPTSSVAGYTDQYFRIRVLSAPWALANFVLAGWLLGMQNARGPLAMSLVANLTNLVLDILFVTKLGLAVRGVALASVIAEMTGSITGLAFVRIALLDMPGPFRLPRLLEVHRYKRLFAVNADLWLRTLSLMFVFGFVTAQGARAGDVILAANSLLMNFQFLLSYVLDGIANAAEALVGKAIGMRDRAGMLLAVHKTLAWSLGLAAVFSVLYLVGGRYMIGLLTSIDTVRRYAGAYLPWLVLSPLVSVWSFLYDGVYVGATRSREMRIVMMSSAFFVFLPVWYVAQPLGNHGLWLAFMAFMAARGLGMWWWFGRLVTSGVLGGAPR
jgi:MATE family multidrug resistance protein